MAKGDTMNGNPTGEEIQRYLDLEAFMLGQVKAALRNDEVGFSMAAACSVACHLSARMIYDMIGPHVAASLIEELRTRTCTGPQRSDGEKPLSLN